MYHAGAATDDHRPASPSSRAAIALAILARLQQFRAANAGQTKNANRPSSMTPDSPPDAAGRARWFLLGIATVAQVSVSAIRLGILALMPYIRQDLGLDRAQVGLISSVINAGAVAAGIPAGKAVDRYGERLVIGWGCILSGLVILGVLFARNFPALLVILIATGLLNTSAVPAGGKLVAKWFRNNERGTAMGIRQTGVPLGGAIAAVTLPPLALFIGWRAALAVVGVVAIVIGIGALYVYREPSAAALARPHGARIRVRSLLARNDLRAVLAYVFLFGASQWCFLTYLALYLTEAINLSVVAAGALLGLGQLCGTLGRVGWGLASDRLFGGRRRPALLLVGALAVAATLALALISPGTPIVVIAGIVALLGVNLQGWNGLAHALAAELGGARGAAVALGMTSSVGFIGVVLLPPLFGALVDWAESYRAAWVVLSGLLVAALGALFLVHEPPERF